MFFSHDVAVVQYQDLLGNWIDVERVPNQSPLIIQGMQKASRNLNFSRRVRAVDEDGRVLDIL